MPAAVPLRRLATARSGDKGNHANIGVMADSPEGYEILLRELTAERVGQFFQGLGVSRVERYELPKVQALNFVLYDALAGGASLSLRIDTQGKLLGTAILDLELPCPDGFSA
ncbi:MAG: hypothetical protein KY475_05970 [Planctomycetes bacterium]|nr:hypothetical protein [Planctomycetota bacterium]